MQRVSEADHFRMPELLQRDNRFQGQERWDQKKTSLDNSVHLIAGGALISAPRGSYGLECSGAPKVYRGPNYGFMLPQVSTCWGSRGWTLEAGQVS